MKHVQTFRASCAAADKTSATAWLSATETLKGPEEAAYDTFVHVMKGLMQESPVVVKLQELSRLSEKESQIAQLLSRYDPPNVAYPICEFKCKNDLIAWRQPLKTPKHFCSGKTDMTSVFVMEYIPHNLIDYLTSTSVSEQVYRSIVQQLGLALLNLYVNLKMTHGDIGSGNLMLDISEPKTLSYTIGGHRIDVNTLGYEPIFIDFQRSVRYKGAPDATVVADEIAMTYDILNRWVGGVPLTPIIDALADVADIEDVIRILMGI